VTDHTPWPTVDVVIPTRERPQPLAEAIEAVLAQDYPGDVRVLVVFDQTEPDPSLSRRDDRRRVVVVANDRKPGLAGARNTGLLAADAELVAFCDDDDVWLPGKLWAQVELLAANPGTSLVASGVRIRYDDHTVDRRVSDRLGGRPVELDDLLRDRLTELHPSTFLMPRRIVREHIGLVDEEIPGSYGEDYEFLLRAARQGPILAIEDIGVEVRWHQQSYFTSRWDTIVTALSWLLEKYPEFDRVPAGKARITGQIAFASAAKGDRGTAVHWARQTIRTRPTEARAYLALGVASGAVSADAVLRRLHSRGRGI
jgi:glycosyltransferase involved in cell wall biosynthesis